MSILSKLPKLPVVLAFSLDSSMRRAEDLGYQTYDTIYLEYPSRLNQDLHVYVYYYGSLYKIGNLRYTRVIKTTPFQKVEFRWDSASGQNVVVIIGNPETYVPTPSYEPVESVLTDRLDVSLSTRASESTLSSINQRLSVLTDKLDVSLSTRASESTLSSINHRLDVNLSTRASESTLTSINQKLSQPTGLYSVDVVIDNSTGTSNLTNPLFTSSRPSKSAVILRDTSDTGTIYIGSSTSQTFPMTAGMSIKTEVSDLSVIYVRVPAGVKATLHVLYEV